VAVVLVLALGVMMPGSVSERLSGTVASDGEPGGQTSDTSAISRRALWEHAIGIARAHPMAGIGFNTYASLNVLGLQDTHNYYLKVLVEQGVPGFLLFLVLLWRMLQQGYKLSRMDTNYLFVALGTGFAGCMVAAVVANVFGDRWSYLQEDGYLWILLALTCRATLLSRQTQTDEPAIDPVPVEALQPA